MAGDSSPSSIVSVAVFCLVILSLMPSTGIQLCLLVVRICSVTPHRERRLEEVVEILEEQGMMLVVERMFDCLLDSAGLRVCMCVYSGPGIVRLPGNTEEGSR